MTKLLEAFRLDAAFALRTFRRNPGFFAIATATLALGIGANTAIFSVMNEVLLASLPYREVDRLVMVWEHNRPRAQLKNVISPANFIDWKEQNNSFDDMAAFRDAMVNLTGVDDPEQIGGMAVTPNFFALLGAGAARGRTLMDDDGRTDSPNVTVLSWGLWQRRFGADDKILGKTIKLNGIDFAVVGIMPPDFRFFVKDASFFGKQAELWFPQRFSPQSRIRRGRSMASIARLKPGLQLDQARSDMNALATRLEQQYPDFNKNWGVNLVPLTRQLTGDVRTPLYLLAGAVGLVLLIACANVANLLLARASGRHKEVALRAALGAGRSRIFRQLLTESLMLALAGGILGLLLAVWGVNALLALAPESLLQVRNAQLDTRVLGFTAAVATATGMIFGLIPALVSSRLNLNQSLKEGAPSVGGSGNSRLRGLFVVLEVALAVILLVCAGLVIKSLARLQSVDPGFDPKNLLTVRISLPGSRYREDPQVIGFFQQLMTKVKTLPGVRDVSGNAFAPFTGSGSATNFTIEGRAKPPAGEDWVTDVRVVTGDYFRTMSIPLRQGRTFSDAEMKEAKRVVIINESLARIYFSNENPIGKRLTINMKDDNQSTEVIGVVGDVKHNGLDSPVRAMIYWPHPELAFSFMTLLVRTEKNPLSLVGAIQREVLSLDKDQPITDVRTMEQLLARSTALSRFASVLLAIFAALAILLASVGVYGVMSYSVAQRTREMGIRLSLGATTSDVISLVFRQGVLLAGLGLAIGLTAAAFAANLFSSLLFGIGPRDPQTFALTAVFLAVVALIACLIPARRASRVNPITALRCE